MDPFLSLSLSRSRSDCLQVDSRAA